MTRDEIVEVMANRRVDGYLLLSCDHPQCSCDHECERRDRAMEREREEAALDLAALEAKGLVVPREKVETMDEHIGALLRIFEGSPVANEADAERVLQIAAAFGQRCLDAALPESPTERGKDDE